VAILKNCWRFGICEYREIFFKPYRIMYRIMDKTVYVPLIADGRREMQTLLQRRIRRIMPYPGK